MDESAPIRAIVIGVSTLIAIATITAVLMYYNTAKQMASNVGRGQDFATNYEQSIKDILLKTNSSVAGNATITGAEVKNLLNYFYGDETVEVDFSTNKQFDNTNYTNYIPGFSGGGVDSNVTSNKGVYETVMKEILDNQKFTLTINNNQTLTNGNTGMKLSINGLG